MGGIGKSIAKFADNALGFDPNGGGLAPLYNIAGTALGAGPVGTMGATGVNAFNQVAGINQPQGGLGGGAFGQLLGGVGAGVAQAQKNREQDKLADRMLGYVDKGINTQQGFYDKSLGLQNKVLSDVPKLINASQNQGMGFLQSNTDKGFKALTNAEGRSLSDLAKSQGISVNQLQQGYGKGIQALQPYKISGDKGLQSLTDLSLNPQAQANLIQNSPFYKSMVNDAQSRLMKNQATRGKLGSGDTAKTLQDEVLKIGSDLMQRELGNRQGLANYGMTASQGQADLNRDLGTSLSNLYNNNAQFGAGLRQNTGNNIANMRQGLGSSLANMVNNNAQFKSGIMQSGANNIGNLNTGMGNTLSNLFANQGDIIGNKMYNYANPFGAGIAQFMQPQQQGQQQLGGSLGGLGSVLSSVGGLFGSGGGASLPTGGGGSFGNLSTSGFGFGF